MTRALEIVVNRTLPVGDKNVSGRILLAAILRDLAIFGKTILPDNESLSVDPKTQVDIIKFIYAQVDGAAKTEVDVTSKGEKLPGLPDAELLTELTRILDTARTRAVGSTDPTGKIPLDASGAPEPATT